MASSRSAALGATSSAEIGFFQAIRTALVKSSAGDGPSMADRAAAIRQIVSRAVVSTDIVNILEAAGIDTPDISVLSDEFLAEIRELGSKNLAVEALRKLLNGEIRAQGERNVALAKAFSERLEGAIRKYHNNAITTAEALEELIQIARATRPGKPPAKLTGCLARRWPSTTRSPRTRARCRR